MVLKVFKKCVAYRRWLVGWFSERAMWCLDCKLLNEAPSPPHGWQVSPENIIKTLRLLLSESFKQKTNEATCMHNLT